MGLVKRTYVDGETVITADNLNDIQDAIIQNEEDITTKGTYSKPTGGIPKTDLATSVQDTLDEVADLEDEVIISDTQPTETNNKLWVKESSSSDGISIPTMDDIDDIEDDIGTIQNTLNQLDQNMAYVESGNTAIRNYSKGDFISWKGTLYTANGTISSGQSFSTGTGGNLEAVAGGGLNAFTTINTASTTPNTLVVQRIEKLVFVTSIQATINNSTVLIPSGYRPLFTIYGPAKYVSNNAWTEGWFRIFDTGIIEILRNDGGILQGNVQCVFTVTYFTNLTN